MGHRRRDLWEQVVAQAAAAATDPSHWVALVRDINLLFGARSTALFTPEPSADRQPLGIVSGDLTEGTEAYFANWAHEDAWLKTEAGRSIFQRAGETRFSQEFLPDSMLRKTEFFNEWARPFNAEQSLALKITDKLDHDAPVLHLTLFRRLTDRPFTQQDRTRLQMLWPHLRRAAQVHWALQSVQQGYSAIESTLEALPTPAWVLRSDAQIDFANAMALDLMRAGDWAHAAWGRLTRIGNLDASALKHAMAESTTFSVQGGHMVALSASVGGRTLGRILHIAPIAAHALYACMWPSAQVLLMLQAASTPAQLALLGNHLNARFKLTPAEGAVLACLGQGMTVEAIATSKRVSIGTVRTHVAKLLSKTGLIKQVDLVRLALGA